LGQNTPAIAATEAHYGEMWSQDAAAMYGYAGSSAAATKVPQLTAPAQTTSSAGLAAQSAAAAQATGSSAGTGVQSTLSQAMSTVPTALQGMSSPAASSSPSSILSSIATPLGLQPGDVSNALTNLASGMMTPYSLAGITQVGSDLAVIRAAAIAPADPFGLGGLDAGIMAPGAGIGAIAPVGSASLGGGAAVSAGMGRATLVGALSVPQGWAGAAPVASPPTTAALVSSWTAAPQAEAAGMAGMPGTPGMPMVGSGGRGIGFAAPRYGFKPTVMAHPPAAG
ncbi:MAG: PPE family protein, SVP subgroup, partial [Mycobacterium sp.]